MIILDNFLSASGKEGRKELLIRGVIILTEALRVWQPSQFLLTHLPVAEGDIKKLTLESNFIHHYGRIDSMEVCVWQH